MYATPPPPLRDVVWLPPASGESHCFTNGSRAFAYIRPFSVGSSTSEFAGWPSVDKNVVRSGTYMLPLGEDIEQGGLAGTKSAYEGRKCTGLDMTVKLVEKPTGSTTQISRECCCLERLCTCKGVERYARDIATIPFPDPCRQQRCRRYRSREVQPSRRHPQAGGPLV